MKEILENFIDEVIKNHDYELLDILWILSYSLPCKTAYKDFPKTFNSWLRKVCIRNLEKKYNMKSNEITEKLKNLMYFLNSYPDFLSYKTYDEETILLREILTEKTSKLIIQDIKNKIQNLTGLDKKILSFTFNYIPIRIQDSIKEAEIHRQNVPTSTDKYYYLPDFFIRLKRDTNDISHFEIKKEWMYIFNEAFDEKLKEKKFKIKSQGKRRGIPSIPIEQLKEYSYWQFGDELVRMGIGYWIGCMSSAENIDLYLVIPNFIYEGLKNENLILPQDLIDRINEIKVRKAMKNVEVKQRWNIEEVEELDSTNNVLEADIEDYLVSHPEILEEGLEIVGRQYSTPVGYIDILFRDKKGDFVVVELKRGLGSYKVVGQIQKYMTWVIENCAKDKQVKGIIIVMDSDTELDYALKGSKYTIKVKNFGQEPPIEENTKYCDKCRTVNKGSAKYCVKCGEEFWL